MSNYYENFVNEQLHHALAKAVAERDEAREESKRLEAICVSVHDRLLRGDDDSGLLKILEEAWQKAARHKEAAK